MPGTDPADTVLTPGSRVDLVRNLTIAGWLLLGGPIGFIAFQFERFRDVTEQPFAGVWDQRIEVLSFLMLPPNLVVLAPATFVAAIATWLAGAERDEREPWLNTLLRFVAAIAIVFGVIGLASVVTIVGSNDGGPTDFEGVYLRLGGIAMAAGLAMICRTADRSVA